MSRGTRITPLRLPDDLVARIDEAIASNNVWRADEEYNRTSWIVQAIKERLAKQERGRQRKASRRNGLTPAGTGPEQPAVEIPGAVPDTVSSLSRPEEGVG